MRASLAFLHGLAALVLFAAGPAAAQVTPGGTPPGAVGRPGAVESAPLPPPTAPAEQAAPPASVPPPAAQAAPPAGGAPATRITTEGRATLIPEAGDPADVDQVTLPGKPAAVLAGTSTWDDGFSNLQNAFRKIEEELARAAVSPAGKPLTVFLETDDMGFRYEAMVPIAEVPAGRASLSPEVRFGRTPEGAAMRFVHKGAYEEIDETYETITAYLDAKGVAVRDIFIEEYASDMINRDDPNLEVNIFVQPK
ncbi:MAG TPA: GyrI-like domain-containing protein [Microvirga sp.]|nr:GyrI-like domain-containing protein [Microvirga sp.]